MVLVVEAKGSNSVMVLEAKVDEAGVAVERMGAFMSGGGIGGVEAAAASATRDPWLAVDGTILLE